MRFELSRSDVSFILYRVDSKRMRNALIDDQTPPRQSFAFFRALHLSPSLLFPSPPPPLPPSLSPALSTAPSPLSPFFPFSSDFSLFDGRTRFTAKGIDLMNQRRDISQMRRSFRILYLFPRERFQRVNWSRQTRYSFYIMPVI